MITRVAIIMLGFIIYMNPNIFLIYSDKEEEMIFLTYSNAYPSQDKLRSMYPNCSLKGVDCDKIASYLSRIYNLRDSVYYYWNIQYPEPSIIDLDTLTLLSDLTIECATNVILEEVKEKKFIIINEAHHRAEHRLFTQSLLVDLKRLGFTHIGFEALHCSQGVKYHNNNFPTLSDGHYIREPNFGNLIREAKRLDLKIFGYDCGRKYENYRDIDAAEFIHSICEDSTAKIILHVGWGHVREDDKISGGLLAYRLKETCNTDPLTIQQTRYMDNFGSISHNNPLYNKLKNRLKYPGIPFSTATNKAYFDGICDLAIFQPSTFEYPNYRDAVFINEKRIQGYIMFIPSDERIRDLPVPVCIYKITSNDEKLIVKIPYEKDCKIYLLNDTELTDLKILI